MTEKIEKEIEVKAKQVTSNLIAFMKGLDTEANKQTKELELDIKFYESKIEELKNLMRSEHELEARKNNRLISQITKAKEIIEDFMITETGGTGYSELYDKAEQFLKDIEVEK